MADEPDQHQEEVKETVTLMEVAEGCSKIALALKYIPVISAGAWNSFRRVPNSFSVYSFFLGEVIKRVNANAFE